jgi:hypothetical protein
MASILLNSFQLIANAKVKQRESVDTRVFGRRLGLISRIVGCPHKDVGRPFVEGKTGYRSCLSCGARKPFNTETLETSSSFYCPPAIQS